MVTYKSEFRATLSTVYCIVKNWHQIFYFPNNSYMLKISKNNPKNKLSDFETTIKVPGEKKKKRKQKTKMYSVLFRKILLSQSEI